MTRATSCLARATRLLPVLTVLVSLFLPSESSAFIRRDLSPDAGFLAAETCRNVPVAYKDPTGKENEIVATVGGVTVGRWPSASDYATYNVRINGGGVLDPGAFEVYAGNAGADVVAAVEINKQAAALLVPRPDLTYRLGQQQAGIAFDPAKSGLEKSLGSLGLVSASILTVGEFIPVVNVGVRPISRVLGRVALTEAERGVEKAVARAEVAAARNLAEDAAKRAVPLPAGEAPYQLKLFPDETYNRVAHYGRTPTPQQKASVPAGMEFDHTPTLVQHYYEGANGSLPGFNLTRTERLQHAQSLSSGAAATPAAQRAQGAAAAAYSREQKLLWSLE